MVKAVIVLMLVMLVVVVVVFGQKMNLDFNRIEKNCSDRICREGGCLYKGCTKPECPGG